MRDYQMALDDSMLSPSDLGRWLAVEPAPQSFQVLARTTPVERRRRLPVTVLKRGKPVLDLLEQGRVVWRENPALDYGEVDRDLVCQLACTGRCTGTMFFHVF